jgi:hypothetical protein
MIYLGYLGLYLIISLFVMGAIGRGVEWDCGSRLPFFGFIWPIIIPVLLGDYIFGKIFKGWGDGSKNS